MSLDGKYLQRANLHETIYFLKKMLHSQSDKLRTSRKIYMLQIAWSTISLNLTSKLYDLINSFVVYQIFQTTTTSYKLHTRTSICRLRSEITWQSKFTRDLSKIENRFRRLYIINWYIFVRFTLVWYTPNQLFCRILKIENYLHQL